MSELGSSKASKLVEQQMAMHRLLARQAEGELEPPPAPVVSGPAPYVTISRQFGAGGSAIAAQVAERLGWTLYDKALLEEIARDAHLQGKLLEPLDERERTSMDHLVRGLLTEETVSEHHYTRSLFRVVSSIARVGQAVIVGRGAHLLLPDENGLKVRVYAPLKDRVIRIAEREHLTQSEAKRRITRVEESRQHWLLQAFGKRAEEKFTFDLALNTSAIPPEVCVEIIVLALRERVRRAGLVVNPSA